MAIEHFDREANRAAAESTLLRTFAPLGVTAVRSMPQVGNSWLGVWLQTTGDEERDRLLSNPRTVPWIRELLVASGYPVVEASITAVTIQSQETVDRSYDGSWFYAMR
jgi:hypothetical protein